MSSTKVSTVAGGVSEGLEEISTSNVVLVETQQESTGLASQPLLPLWHALSSSEFTPDFSDMCDRFIPWKYFTWQTEGQREGDSIISEVLPISFINSHGKVYCDTVNFIPFNVHAYWRGDIEVKVHVNSNMFQSGQLICAWLYASDSYASTLNKDDGQRYSNIAQLVQKPHVKISAGASNEATLYIPYRYVKPYMRTKPIFPSSVASLTALNMGRLVLTPLVRLKTGTQAASPKQCSGTIFIRLINNSFTGKFSGSIAKPEMMGALSVVKQVAGAVDRVLGDVNCDNPPDTKPAAFLVPINAQSWSHGMRTAEPINTLRLDGRRIGCGRSRDIGYSETDILKVARVFGLLKPFDWRYSDVSQNKAGYQLWGMAVHPQCDKNRMFSTSPFLDSLATYTIPPVGVVSSLFCYWRGSIDFKFEVVSTSKHTGRILIAYVPGVENYARVTLAQAMSSANAEFSLNDGTNAFTFRVPYIAETMWWPRKYGGAQRSSDFVAPSSIVIFVLNPLVPMESVAQEVTFLPYVAAGPDFEVAVPAQPSIGLGMYSMNDVPGSRIISFKNGYFPVYLGGWRAWLNSDKLIFRYGNVTDHIAQTTSLIKAEKNKVIIYSAQVPLSDVIRTNYKIKANQGSMYRDGATGCAFDVAQNKTFDGVIACAVGVSIGGYDYLIPFIRNLNPRAVPTGEHALSAAKIVAFALSNDTLSRVKDACCTWVSDSGWLNQSQNIRWIGRLQEMCSERVSFEMGDETTVEPNPLQPTSFLPSTSSGVVTFGERFNDFKDLCRRYQLYWEGTVTPGQVRANKRNAAFVQIPVMPQGLKLDSSLSNPVWNSMRDGHIPVIASGYRFYRGGMRMRIVVTGLNDSIWVQHHPDRHFIKQEATIGVNIDDKDAYRNHGYGFHVQNLSVNRTIEIEIPFYKPGLYNLLGDVSNNYDCKEYGTLGDIVIGLEGDQQVVDPIDIAIYYSLADDCSFNVFCGFPDMVFCDEVYKGNDEREYEIVETAQPEMMSMAISGISSYIGNTIGNAAFKGSKAITVPVVAAVKDEIRDNINPVMRDIENEVKAAADSLQQSLGRTIPQQAIISALGQFSQVALNPNPSSLAIAVTSLLANFVTISMELVISMQNILTNFLKKTWGRYFSGASDHQLAQNRANREGFFEEMADKELHGFLGLLFTAVASTIGVSCSAPRRFPDVMKGIKECLGTCNSAVVFFRNIVDTITYMYKYCLGETDEELRAKIIVEREYPHMKDWCNEVMMLLDPRNQNAVLHSSRQANRVFDACIYGAKLINENLDRNVPGGRVIYDLYNKICKVRDDLIELGNHPDVRFEAFPIWVSGKAGIGKSHMTQKICTDLLEHIDYRTQECMIYWLALGQKYWNGIKNPPVIARDEAYAVGGQFTEEEIATHLAICSCSILNPPMAALQEKNKRLNPLIYYMNSNMEFPQISEARHPEAIYRRRKVLIRAQYTDHIIRTYPNILDASDLPPNETEGMKHLDFYFAKDPKNKETEYVGPMSYATCIAQLKRRFKDHVDKERENFKNRMRAAYALDPEYNPEDELNFVGSGSLTTETLHDRYIRERDAARRVLYEAPPTISEDEDENGYFASLLQRFSHLWTPSETAEPEMDTEPEPSTSTGITDKNRTEDMYPGSCEGEKNVGVTERVRTASSYPNACGQKTKVVRQEEVKVPLRSATTRDNASFLSSKLRMNAASIVKLVSGGVIFEQAECEKFIISADFEKLIHRTGKVGGIKNRFARNYESSSMLPDCLVQLWKKTTFHKLNWILPHWEEVSGVDCIRSYVYWLLRENQYRSFAKLLCSPAGKKAREDFEKMIKLFTAVSPAIKKALESKTIEEFVANTEFVETIDMSMHPLCDMWLTAYYMTYQLKNEVEGDFCKHCDFWTEYLRDTSSLEYVPRYDALVYTNSLGLRKKCDNYCNCPHVLTNNQLFQNAMRIIWNHDHGTTEHDIYNPFSFSQFKRTQEEVGSWFERTWEWAKDWWKGVAMPFVSTILTFIYEHIGKIIAVLLGLYSLYNLYNSSSAASAASAAKSAYNYASEVIQETAAAAAGAAMASTILKRNVSPEFSGASAEASTYCKMDKPKPAASGFKPATKEGEKQTNTIEMLETKLLNNVCFLEVRWEQDGEIKMLMGRCLGIRERQVLVLKHYVEEMLSRPQPATFCMNYVVSGKHSVAYITRECLEQVTYFKVNGKQNATNFGLLQLPKYMPMFKDILNSIVRQADHHYVSSEGHLSSASVEGRVTRYRHLPLRAKQFLVIDGDEEGGVSQICTDGAYEYSVHGKGMCGSLLLSENVCRGNPGIVAIHVAGARGTGYAEPIFREMFEHESLLPKVTYALPNLKEAKDGKIDLDSNLLTLGLVDDRFIHRESGKTKITPSLLHNKVYPVKTEPNPLRPGDPRQPPGSDPLRDGCNKHGYGFSVPFDQKMLDVVSHDSRMVLRNAVSNPLVEMRELTMEEAVCGSSQIPHCESLNWKSSEGYPLSSLRPPQYTNKKYLFDLKETEEGYKLNGLHPDLQQILSLRASLRERNTVIPPIYIDCLKDYRLPPEKCAIPGKTRIFSIAPVQVTIDLRRYMGLFLAGYRGAGVTAQHGIGINVDSMDWTKLAHYLLEVGDNIVTGDYSNFGPTLSSQVVASCVDDIVDWHEFNGASKEHVENLRFILENEILNPLHLCKDLVYQTLNGIASGSPITAELNSEVNKKYIKLAFLLLVKEKDFKYTMADFNRKVRLVTYGDDFIMSVHNDFIEWFNCATISNVLKRHGIILTDASKGSNIVPYQTLLKSTFLKRSFKKHPYRRNIWLAPIDEQSITECLNWCHKQSNMKAATEEVIRASCDLAFGHGPEFYDKHVNKIHKAAKQEGLLAIYPSWQEMDFSYFG